MDQHSVGNRATIWWNEPSGGREVLRVALPLVISSLSWTVMTFVDRIFLKWVSGEAMAAAFAASMIWFLFLCLPLGICSYANTFVAQYTGNDQNRRVGPSVWQAIWIALFFVPLTPFAIDLGPWIFSLAGHESSVQANEVIYYQYLCLGASGMLVSQAAAAFYSGRGITTVVMWVDGIFALVNLVLDYVWIFGYLGFPEMGIAGAGLATSVSLWLKAATYVLLMLQAKHRRTYATWSGMRFDLQLLRRMLYFGGPSGLQMLLDVLGFTVFVMLIGRLGALEAEATSMAFSISTLAFMPIWGFGMATSILVGQRLGENNPDLAEKATWSALGISMTYMVAISLMYLIVPQLFLWGFFAGAEPGVESQLEVSGLAIVLLRFVAAYNLFDAALMVFVNAIKGAGDTRFVFNVSLVMAIFLAVASYLAVEVMNLGVFGCWVIITAWVWIVAIVFLWRFVQGKWRDMRVIETTTSE